MFIILCKIHYVSASFSREKFDEFWESVSNETLKIRNHDEVCIIKLFLFESISVSDLLFSPKIITVLASLNVSKLKKISIQSLYKTKTLEIITFLLIVLNVCGWYKIVWSLKRVWSEMSVMFAASSRCAEQDRHYTGQPFGKLLSTFNMLLHLIDIVENTSFSKHRKRLLSIRSVNHHFISNATSALIAVHCCVSSLFHKMGASHLSDWSFNL